MSIHGESNFDDVTNLHPPARMKASFAVLDYFRLQKSLPVGRIGLRRASSSITCFGSPLLVAAMD